jgi:hypothetical protein
VGDISDFKIAEKLIWVAIDKFERIGILHNNAGIVTDSPNWEFTEKYREEPAVKMKLRLE